MAKFRPLTPGEIEDWIEQRYQHMRATRRGRSEPLLLIFYGAIIPAIYAFRDNTSEIALQLMLWGWGLLAVIACLVLAFAETDAERARRYSRWVAKYERELDDLAKHDAREAPQRRAAYEEALERYRKENPGYLG